MHVMLAVSCAWSDGAEAALCTMRLRHVSHTAHGPCRAPAHSRRGGAFATFAGRFAKTLLLQFHRSVDADAVAGAMKDSLAKKVTAGTLAKFSDALSQVRPLAEAIWPMSHGAPLHAT